MTDRRVRGDRPTAADDETSARLGRVRQRDTLPERVVRSTLHRLGHRFRLVAKDLPGSPDVVNRAGRWVVFVHGCFWHRHEGCRHATTPKHNGPFWLAKFAANQSRDARVQRELAELGYRVIVVWECETGDDETLAARLACCMARPIEVRGSG